ncbi:hypothetical protein EK21DRAFT_110952 [Setomelanomma holmii]|uniref:Uncharacterized protein n=1 Tax=Setomelanomma holmii TaxID=210430 RepID=A0A9P4LPZ1_9PLEO|nr:hypothetical protein EK21DRAFT_110952 [Setomelanomma holmii]
MAFLALCDNAMIRNIFASGLAKHGAPWNIPHRSEGGEYWAEAFVRAAHEILFGTDSNRLDGMEDDDTWREVRDNGHTHVFGGDACDRWISYLDEEFRKPKLKSDQWAISTGKLEELQPLEIVEATALCRKRRQEEREQQEKLLRKQALLKWYWRWTCVTKEGYGPDPEDRTNQRQLKAEFERLLTEDEKCKLNKIRTDYHGIEDDPDHVKKG